MQPGPDSLSPLWQKYSTVFSPNSLDHAHVLHQRTTPLQFLVDHFRNQLIKEQVSAVRNLDCAIASPGSMAHPHLMDGDVRHRFRSRVSNISMETMHDSATHHHLPSFVSPDTPQVDGMPFPCLPLLQQINKIFPGLIHQTSAKSVMGTEKALFVPPNPNILGHLAYLHRLAMTVFMHQNNPDTSNTGITNDNHFLNHSSTVDLSIPTLDADRVMSDQTANASSSSSTSSSSTITPTAALSTNSITTVSSEIASIRIKTDLQPGEQNSLFGHPGTGLNLTVASSKSLEAKGHLISSSKSGFPLYSKGDDLHRNDNGLERNAFGYPFPDFDSILLRHRPSILPNHDLWASSLGKPIHQMLPAPLPIHQGKKFGCRASDGALPAQENLHESTFNLVEAPRVVRLSNCSLKPIDQLTVSDFVASALHPTASGHASPVAASLTEALLNQCGLELSWVKLAHIRERPGSQTIRLLFNVSSKRHRLPVGTTERIQGRHSSRMLWPQFSGKSFKMHKKLSFDARKDQPFFVHTLGWSSIDPCATWKLWGLVCRQLMVDDICLVLIRQLGPSKKSRSQTVPPQTGALPFTEQAVTISAITRTEDIEPVENGSTRVSENSASGDTGLSVDSLQTTRLAEETVLSNSSPHEGFSRMHTHLKRICSEQDHSNSNQVDGTTKVEQNGIENYSKRLKTDEPLWKTTDCSEKSIFFSATNLAQSHECSHDIRGGEEENSGLEILH